MIISNPTNTVLESSLNAQGTTKCTIQASGKVFQLLSKNLYSNPIKSVVREISSNALDSHKNAGRADVPFDITLPDNFNSSFVVTDHGTGMSHVEMQKIYSEYLNSTKNLTNDNIGGFGLGSKSPLAYTDSFSMICAKDNIQNTYVVFFDETGATSFNLVQSTSVDSTLFKYGSGVSVVIPVQPKDFNAFKEAVLYYCSYFEVKPNVNSNVDWFKIEDVLTVKGKSLKVNSSGYSNVLGITFVQGNIAYKTTECVNTKQLPGLQNNFVVYVPIGTLDVSLSRENLEVNQKNTSVIANTKKEIEDHISNYIAHTLQEISTEPGFIPLNTYKKFMSSSRFFVDAKHPLMDSTDFFKYFTITRYSKYGKPWLYRPTDKVTYFDLYSRYLESTTVFNVPSEKIPYKSNRLNNYKKNNGFNLVEPNSNFYLDFPGVDPKQYFIEHYFVSNELTELKDLPFDKIKRNQVSVKNSPKTYSVILSDDFNETSFDDPYLHQKMTVKEIKQKQTEGYHLIFVNMLDQPSFFRKMFSVKLRVAKKVQKFMFVDLSCSYYFKRQSSFDFFRKAEVAFKETPEYKFALKTANKYNTVMHIAEVLQKHPLFNRIYNTCNETGAYCVDIYRVYTNKNHLHSFINKKYPLLFDMISYNGTSRVSSDVLLKYLDIQDELNELKSKQSTV